MSPVPPTGLAHRYCSIRCTVGFSYLEICNQGKNFHTGTQKEVPTLSGRLSFQLLEMGE